VTDKDIRDQLMTFMFAGEQQGMHGRGDAMLRCLCWHVGLQQPWSCV
jgi:hypothetical protein